VFKTLTSKFGSPVQAFAAGNLTIGSLIGGNTETCLAPRRLETLAGTRRNEIDG
jgi:hypothetical protein